VTASEPGSWKPLRPEDARRWLEEFGAPWWIAGGWALDLFVGHETRAHEDLDVGCFRADLPRLAEALRGFELHAAQGGRLTRVPPGGIPGAEVHTLWCRPAAEPEWWLEILLDELTCLELDVIASVPYQADIFDPGGTLLLSFTTSSPTYALPAEDRIYEGYRVVLTPGLLVNGERDELRVDNMRAAYAPVSTRPSTWGAVKLIYRAH